MLVKIVNAIKAVMRRISGFLQIFILKLLYGKKVVFLGNPVCGGRLHVSIESDGILKIGKNLSVRRGFECRCIGEISIGDDCFFNNYCTFTSMEKIQIGDKCIFGEKVSIFDHNHNFKDKNIPIRDQGFTTGQVVIGNNVWLGSNVTVLKGVSIGDNCVIGANCLIYEDIPANSVVRLDEELTFIGGGGIMKPKVSIIIPVYKVEKYLKRCLDSVLNQSLKEIEVILIDDGSPDKCGDICDAYAEVDNRIKVIHKENAGVSSARNSGLALATGEYIGFVDSDDYVAETMFEDMYRQAILADAEMAICQFTCTDGETADLSHKRSYEDGEIFKLSPTEAFEVIADFSINVRVTVWNKIYKRELIQDLNFDIQKRMAEDFEFLMRVLVKCSSIVYIPYALYAYFTQRKGAATFHGDNDIDWYLEQNANVTSIMDEVAQSSREMRKLAVGYKCVYGDLSIVNALVRKGQLNSEVAKNVREDLRRNFFVVMQSKLNFIKKIQISLFIVSPALYKALMGKMIGA